jgi:hypothetical protein
MTEHHTETITMPFSLGQLVATPGALEALEESGQQPSDFLSRHTTGDWGEVCQEDWKLNDDALKDGSRILSAYRTLKGKKLWIITEATDDDGQRAATTLLLPEEY